MTKFEFEFATVRAQKEEREFLGGKDYFEA